MTLVTLDEIRMAARRLTGVALRTPVLPAAWAPPDAALLLKAENLQPIGAFKIRGAYNKIAALPGRGARARRGRLLERQPRAGRRVRRPGVRHPGRHRDPARRGRGEGGGHARPGRGGGQGPGPDRATAAAELAERYGRVVVPPFDDREVIAGQGTIGLELAEDAGAIDRVLVPISGGGLISGIAVAIKALSPATQVIGVEPAYAADARRELPARRAGGLVRRCDRSHGRRRPAHAAGGRAAVGAHPRARRRRRDGRGGRDPRRGQGARPRLAAGRRAEWSGAGRRLPVRPAAGRRPDGRGRQRRQHRSGAAGRGPDPRRVGREPYRL